MDLQLGEKTALVTGSSKGIGEAIALALAREGAMVVVHGRDRAQIERVVDAIAVTGGRVYPVLGDLTDNEAVERLISEAQERVSTIDILVNNAGGSGPKSDWQAAIGGLGIDFRSQRACCCSGQCAASPGDAKSPLGAYHQHIERSGNSPSGDRSRLFRSESGNQRDDRINGEAVAAEG